MYIYTHTNIYKYIHTNIKKTCIQTHINTYTHTYTLYNMHAFTYIQVDNGMRIYIHTIITIYTDAYL